MIHTKAIGAAVVGAVAISFTAREVAHAATITGNISGTWEYSYGLATDTGIGDQFNATYSYDDSTLTASSSSVPGEYQQSGYYGKLLSLSVISGSYTHTFDFTNVDLANGYSNFSFTNFVGDPAGSSPYSYKLFGIYGEDYTNDGGFVFNAEKQVGYSYNGTLFNHEFAYLSNYDYNTNTYPIYVSNYSQVKFTPDPTAIPTPALLPGLIGMGIAALRKHLSGSATR